MAKTITARPIASRALALFALCCGLALLAGASPPPQTERVTYSWTAPTVGPPVARYEVWVRFDLGDWEKIAETPSPSYTFDTLLGKRLLVKVRAVDAQGRFGPFSLDSATYTPEVADP